MSTSRRDLLKLGALASAAMLAAAPASATTTASPPPRANRSLRILILGGTGFIGPHQVRYALQRGHTVTLFNRGRRPQEWPTAVEELTGDRETADLGALARREWDVCIDNPTSVPHWVRDVGGILNGNVGQYIFISTLSVYADTATTNQDETATTATYAGLDVMQETRASLLADMRLYGPLKAACEVEAKRQFPDNTSIVRPGLIVGPGDETDRFTYWPVRIARGGDVLAPGDGSDPVQLIDARDLAEWTIRLAEARSLGTFNAMGPNYAMSMAAMLHGIQAVTTAGARLHWVPVDVLEVQKVSPWGDMPAWVPGSGETAGFARHSNARALEAGLTFRSLAETAGDTLNWFTSLPPERHSTLRAGIDPQREAAVLSAWKTG